jgi:hypothetical protein
VQVRSARPPRLAFSLAAGETEVIALALTVQADVLLMDEKRGREAAPRLGLTVAGALGELLHARKAGLVSDLRAEIGRLPTEAGFFFASEIVRIVLSEAGD